MTNTETKSPLKVFLCHSNEDKDAVRVLYQDLRKDGFDPWLDEEKLVPGQDWNFEIKKSEREADAIIVCISKLSTTKEGYVQKEIKFALDIADEKPDNTIFIIPARLENCNLPIKLARWQWVDLFLPKGYSKLKEALQSRHEALNPIARELKINSVTKDEFVKKKNLSNIDRNELSNDSIDQDVSFEKPQNQGTLLGALFSLAIFTSLFYLMTSTLFFTLATMKLVEPTGIFAELNPGIVMLISILLSQMGALFFVTEAYGITKLTGFRYRVSLRKIYRTIAWVIIGIGFISWTSMSVIGLTTIDGITLSLSESVSSFLLFLFFIAESIIVTLTIMIYGDEAGRLPSLVIQLINKKRSI